MLIAASQLFASFPVIPNMKVTPLGKLVRCWQQKVSVKCFHILSIEEGPWVLCH